MVSPNDKALLQEIRTVRDDLTQLVSGGEHGKPPFDRAQAPGWETELKTCHDQPDSLLT